MDTPTSSRAAWILATGLALVAGAALAEDPPVAAGPTFRDVRPIFARACTHCHGGDRPVQGLTLESLPGVLKGGKGGPSVIPGAPQKSPLVLHLRGKTAPQMPLDGDPLPEAELLLIEKWVEAGAPDEAKPATPPPAPPAPQEPDGPKPGEPVTWRHVGPILRANCVRCHQPRGIRGEAPEGIRFDDYAAAVAPVHHVAVLPGRPDASPLLRALAGKARRRMPLDGPPWLPEAQVALLRRWIADGARGADGKPAAMPVGRELRLFGVFDGVSKIDGVEVVVGAETRLEKGVVKGALVEVQARVGPQGEPRALRIRVRKADDKPEDRPGHGGGDRKPDDYRRGRGKDD